MDAILTFLVVTVVVFVVVPWVVFLLRETVGFSVLGRLALSLILPVALLWGRRERKRWERERAYWNRLRQQLEEESPLDSDGGE